MLRRKLRRDLFRQMGQMSAIVMVLACGIATLVMALGVMTGLERARDDFYRDAQFAEVFVRISQAPAAIAREVRKIPGVEGISLRIETDVRIEVPGLPDSATVRLIGTAPDSDPRMNRLVLRRGRMPLPAGQGGRGEALVGEAFFQANRLEFGQRLSAVVRGRRVDLTVVGTVLSPEYVFSIREGAGLPDNRRFGVFWVDYGELASAVGMPHAFNNLALRLDEPASGSAVVAALDRLLEPYGCRGAYRRTEQTSHRYTTDAVNQLRSMALFMPVFFVAVAAFLVHMVLSRLVQTQREQIAVLRAFGFTRREIGRHYFELVLVLVAAGVTLGVFVGRRMAAAAVDHYRSIYRFPSLEADVRWEVIGASTLLALTICSLGAFGSVRRAMRLRPAEGMRAETPPTFRRREWAVSLERLFSQPTRMILRQLERRPWKAGLASLGIALGVAVMVLGCFVQDSIEYIVDYEFQRQRHQDVTVMFNGPQAKKVADEVRRWPGVLESELFRTAAVRVEREHRGRSIGLTALPAGNRLFVPLSRDGRPANLLGGVALSAKLSEALDAPPGTVVRIELQEGRRQSFEVPVVGLVTDYSGLNAYMTADALDERLGRRGEASGVILRCDKARLDDLFGTLRATPQVADFNVTRAVLDNFRKNADNLLVMRIFNIGFATVIAVGVVYNIARISMAERLRELATLRVLGFTRGAVSYVLIGELAILTVCALPAGLVLGWLFAGAFVKAVSTETQRLPLVISPATYGWGAMVVLAAAMVSALIVRREIARLSLMELLRARD
jgi:putative ABC transport system permease protein